MTMINSLLFKLNCLKSSNVTEEGIWFSKKRSFNLTFKKNSEGETYIFKVTKLFLVIEPEKCNIKIVKEKSEKKVLKLISPKSLLIKNGQNLLDK